MSSATRRAGLSPRSVCANGWRPTRAAAGIENLHLHDLRAELGSRIARSRRADVGVRFEDRFEDQHRRGLHHPIADGRDAERALGPANGLRDQHPLDRLRCVASGADLLASRAELAVPPGRLDGRKRLPVHALRPRRSRGGARRRARKFVAPQNT
jgi:hypothetical protein